MRVCSASLYPTAYAEFRRRESCPTDSVPNSETDQKNSAHKPQAQNGDTLTAEEKSVIAELKSRDREVKAHEAAHIAAGGGCVRGGATYTYQNGPDGRRYAVGGEVNIDCSPENGDPQATIAKMQVVRRAALAPADPSGQDRAVAAAASAAEAQARRELNAQKSQQKAPGSDSTPKNGYSVTNSPPVTTETTHHIDLQA